MSEIEFETYELQVFDGRVIVGMLHGKPAQEALDLLLAEGFELSSVAEPHCPPDGKNLIPGKFYLRRPRTEGVKTRQELDEAWRAEVLARSKAVQPKGCFLGEMPPQQE